MAGFSSMDDFINEVSVNGHFKRIDWNKSFLPTTAAAAGEWHCLCRGAGNPPADTLYNTGANLTFQTASESTSTAGGMYHGGNVSPDYKFLVNASGFSAAATTMPSVLMLVDLIGFIRTTTITATTVQSVTNNLSAFSNFTVGTNDILTHTNINLMPYTKIQTSTSGVLPTGLSAGTDYYVIPLTDTTCKLSSTYAGAVASTAISITSGTGSGTHSINTLYPRHTNGAGVQAFIWNTNATAMGAATPTFTMVYTNSAQTSSRTTPTVLPVGKTAGANGLILYSGTASGKYGPFMPLMTGDAGVASVQSIQLSASYVSGEFSIGLCKPIAILPMTTIGVAAERDFMNMIPSLPRIYDGANLVWLLYSGANTPTNSSFYGHLDVAWG